MGKEHEQMRIFFLLASSQSWKKQSSPKGKNNPFIETSVGEWKVPYGIEEVGVTKLAAISVAKVIPEDRETSSVSTTTSPSLEKS